MVSPLKIGRSFFDFSRTYIMGIVNLTPDSFSDGGQFLNPDKALISIEKMIEDGADIVDIGAESSRPGSLSISAREEIQRLEKVLSAYPRYFSTPLSLDTTKSDVAEFGLSKGVSLINDISGLTADPLMAKIVKKHNAAVVLMHRKGDSVYQDVMSEVMNALKLSIQTAIDNGIVSIILDPGIGFGKTLAHNLEILRKLDHFKILGYPLLVGTSRKSFLGALTGKENPLDRLEATISSNVAAVMKGAHFIRVHDVKALKTAIQVVDAILKE